MNRFLVPTLILAGGLSAMAVPADAQLSASVHISWTWTDDGWRSGSVVDGYVHWSDHHDGRAAYREPMYRAPVRAQGRPGRSARLRIPPGHLPPPGMCRVWIVGVPPGHQPLPGPCGRVLMGYQGPDIIVLHTPWRDGRAWAPDRRWRGDGWERDGAYHRDDDRWDRGRPGRGRGGPPGRGRGPGRG